MKQFKIRASQIGQIMSKKGLGKTGETYLKTWYKEQFYNRKRDFQSKYTQKGNECEDNSLDFVAEMLGLGMILKNEKYFENDFITGTPDAIIKDLIIDVKNSWDCFTFPLTEKECPNEDYYWQAQGYMNLTGLRQYKLIYVLSDTPRHLIEREAFFYAKNNGYEELDQDIYDMFEKKMTYPDVDFKNKIKIFDIQYNESAVNLIEQRVLECRKFLNEID